MKKVILFPILLLLSSIGVMGACWNATENMTATGTENNTLCGGGEYQFNDSEGYGAIKFVGNNINFDCNYSAFYGNKSTNSILFKINSKNVTLKNCIVEGGYKFGVNIGSASDRLTIKNSNFTAVNGIYSYGAIYSDRATNSTYLNNYFKDTLRGIGIFENNYNDGYNEVINNTFINCTTGSLAITGLANNVTGNRFYNSTATYSIDFNNAHRTFFDDNYLYNQTIYLRINSSNNTISNNGFYSYTGTTQAMQFVVGTTTSNTYVQYNNVYNSFNWLKTSGYPIGVYISNNYIFNITQWSGLYITEVNGLSVVSNNIDGGSIGISAYLNVSNSTFENNTITNTANNYDGYNLGIYLSYNCSNNTIKGNRVTNYGSVGIYVRQTNNTKILNNYIDQMSDADKTANLVSDHSMYPYAIGVGATIKGYVSDGTENNTADNISKMYTYLNDIVEISGNTFGDNVKTYLWFHGNQSISHDIVGNWKKFQAPLDLYPVETFINKPSVSIFNCYDDSGVQQTNCKLGYNHNLFAYKWRFNISLSNQFDRWTWYNISGTQRNDIKVFNLSLSNTLINSSGTYQDRTETELNQTIQAGKCVDVIYYTAATDPKLSEVLDPCGLTGYTYTAADKTLTLTCTNGSINVSYIQVMAGIDGVNVYHDGVFVERTKMENYTISSCSQWDFYPSDLEAEAAASSCSSIKGNILTALSFISLLVIIVVGGLLVLAVMGKFKVDWQDIDLGKVVIGVVIVGFVATIGMLILGGIC